ncbi:MAG: glycosyltransferase [Methylocystis sp.]|uniref:glycosyltransferase n=1 Tax=Methylocystis sp. TaxID=1911079 RepID=UPI003DA278DB
MPEERDNSAGGRQLPLISVVFVTYNRVVTLGPTLTSFLSNTDYPRDRLELVVADDGSPLEAQRAIREMGFDVCALSPVNRGMGANVNQGIEASRGDYLLHIQDDWVCVGPPNYLRRAVAVLETNNDVGLVICRPHPRCLGERRRAEVGDDAVRIFDNDPRRQVKMVGDHAYTDWPHLKRRLFIQTIGEYKESRRMWETELDYAQRVNAQTRYFIADIVGLDAFRHIGQALSYNHGPLAGRIAAHFEKYSAIRPFVHLARRLKRRLSNSL